MDLRHPFKINCLLVHEINEVLPSKSDKQPYLEFRPRMTSEAGSEVIRSPYI